MKAKLISMENLHLLPTDKPSRLYSKNGNHKLDNSTMAMDWYISSAGYKPHNIYITSDKEIKDCDYAYFPISNEVLRIGNGPFESSLEIVKDNKDSKKIILTTDPDLIKDGVQAIDDEFLEWFVKNPSCEWVEVKKRYSDFTVDPFVGYKIIIPKVEPKQETLEEAAENYSKITLNKGGLMSDKQVNGFIAGAKWQQERSYSEEEVGNIANWAFGFYKRNDLSDSELEDEFNRILVEQFKKK